ncbi:MAG: SNF2-related protein [Candidatus Cloacimonetes bacterium]|nr:SNF2-related protein [Candidatus Cloacimonadota bacterium]
MRKLFAKEFHEQSNSWYFNNSIKLYQKDELNYSSYIDEKGMVIFNFSPVKDKKSTVHFEVFIIYDKNKKMIIEHVCSKCKNDQFCDHYLSVLKFAYQYLGTDMIESKEIQIYKNKIMRGSTNIEIIRKQAKITLEGLINDSEDKFRVNFQNYLPMRIIDISRYLAEKTLTPEEEHDLHLSLEQMELLSDEEISLLRVLQMHKIYTDKEKNSFTLRKESFKDIYPHLFFLKEKLIIAELNLPIMIVDDVPPLSFIITKSNSEKFMVVMNDKDRFDSYIIGNNTYFFKDNMLFRYSIPFLEDIQQHIFTGGLEIDKNDLAFFSTIVYERLTIAGHYLLFDKDIKLPYVMKNQPTPHFYLMVKNDTVSMRGELVYSEKHSIPLSVILYPTNLVMQTSKNKQTWFFLPELLKKDLISFLNKLPRHHEDYLERDSTIIFKGQDSVDLLKKKLFLHLHPSWQIILPEELKKEFVYRAELKPSINIKHSENLDWLEYDVEYSFEDIHFSHEELQKFFGSNDMFYKLEDGRMLFFSNPEIIDSVSDIIRNSKKGSKSRYRLTTNKITFFGKLLNSINSKSVSRDNIIDEILTSLKERQLSAESPIPIKISSILRTYQKRGFQWIKMLERFSFSGLLADDMGLGKSVQALAVIKSLKERPTSIIVCPKTLVFNWIAEIEKFTPSLRYLIYSGGITQREKLRTMFSEIDVVVTSYSMIVNDLELLKEIEFKYLIIDEAQHIKNPKAVRTLAVKRLNSKYRLALTGTPIENSLSDLWSIFDFLMPGYLRSHNLFRKEFIQDNSPTKSALLKDMICPFVLRRTKDEVLSELPDKQEQLIYCNMSELQRKLYSQLVTELQAMYRNYDNSNREYFNILSGLTKLRQLTDHPCLIDKDLRNSIDLSGKLETMVEIITELLEGNRKILIFSQFLEILSILRKHFDKQKYQYEYLDGNTQNRKETVDNFNHNDNIRLFLVSLKVGGIGLNLTAADTVILTEPWWNPTWEMQAVDRVYRIGQKKKVISFRMITKDSIEEKIFLLQQKKRKLFTDILDADKTKRSITKEEIGQLLGLLV